MIFTPRVNEVLEINFKLGGGGTLHFIRSKLLSKVGLISVPRVLEFCLKAICLLVNHVKSFLLFIHPPSVEKYCF